MRFNEEVDSLISRAVSFCATLLKSPQDTECGGYPGYFADPDGYLWEIAWNRIPLSGLSHPWF
jgi:hypothetical protein